MRDIGYSFQTAAADIIDNSLAAAAKKIDVIAELDAEIPFVAFIDDGGGMNLEELREAMRPGTKGPLAERSSHDLGRFGLGLKTASFSQCRRLTVASRRPHGGQLVARTWNLDHVAETNDWLLQIPDMNCDRLSELGRLIDMSGTLVLWENLDRLSGGTSDDRNRVLSDAAEHLQLVFHRFLTRPSSCRVRMSLNGRALTAIDPFFEKHPATLKHPTQRLKFRDSEIEVQGFTIPDHKQMSDTEYEAAGLDGGHTKNQGFYLYRRERLIMHGGWLGIVKPSHTRQLARVRVDVPAEMDADWRIDIKKSSAQLPPHVRAELKSVIEQLGHGSKRNYKWNGMMTPIQKEWGLWNRRRDGDHITYEINTKHEAITAMRAASTLPRQNRAIDRALSLIAASLPLDAIFSDLGSSPTDIKVPTLDQETLRISMQNIASKLLAQDLPKEQIRELILAIPHFKGDLSAASRVLDDLLKSPDWSTP